MLSGAAITGRYDIMSRLVAMKDLGPRVGSALMLAPPVIYATWSGGMAFAILVGLIAGISYFEWTAITGTRRPHWLWWANLAGLLSALLFITTGRSFGALLCVAVPALISLLARSDENRRGWLAYGMLYVALPAFALLVLRGEGDDGRFGMLFVVVIVWTTDIAAYFGGRAIGGPKLWSRISPKKTWSGSLVGFTMAIAAAVLLVAGFERGSLLAAALVAALLSIATQLGDLFESFVKRRFGVNDSGRIIPGHGGVLDRVDGLYGALLVALGLAVVGIGSELGFTINWPVTSQ